MKRSILRSFYFSMMLFVMLFTALQVQGAGDGGHGGGHEEAKEHGGNSELIEEIRDHFEEAKYILEHKADDKKADSLLLAAIDLAEQSYNDHAKLEAYVNFLDYSYIEVDYDLVKDIVYRTEKVIKSIKDHQLVFRAYVAITEAWLKQLDPENSLSYALRTTSIASADPHPEHKAKAFLLAGNAMSLNGHKEDAYENYLLANEQIAKLQDPNKGQLGFEYDGYLFSFYLQINQFDKALEHKMQQLKYAKEQHKDSMVIYELELDNCRVKLEENKLEGIQQQLEEIVDYFDRNEYEFPLRIALSFYRTLLLKTQNLEGFTELFQHRFPSHLQIMKDEFPPMYCLVKAYIHEYNKQIDSADYYMELGSSHLDEFGSNIYTSNYYKRYGQYLNRTERPQAALGLFVTSYEKASEDDYLKYMLESASLAEHTALDLEDYKLAHQFGQKKSELTIKKTLALHEDNMLKMELKSQARHMEYLAEKKDEAKKRKFSLQYMIIVISIAVLFIFLIFSSSLAVPEWLIEMLGFISILFLFEFIILLLDHKIHHATHGAPLPIFLIKVSILIFLFPLHHLVEHWTTDYMKEHKMIHHVNKRAFTRLMIKLWPWLGRKETKKPEQ